ncbi:MAG: hypothetical protein R6U96_04165 [Promethearchaeia archaeon]
MLKSLFEKIKPAYFALLTGMCGGLTVLIGSILYMLAEPFSLFSHWISHLGAGPNGAQYVFMVGLTITSIFATIFIIFLFQFLSNNIERHQIMIWSAFLFGILSIIGLEINAIWNMRDNSQLHITGSTTFFFAGLFMILFFSLSMIFCDEIANSQAIIGFGVTGVFIAFLISYVPYMTEGIDLMVLLKSTDLRAAPTRFIEWMVFFAIIFWFFEIGFYFLRKKTEIEVSPP